MRDRPRVLTVEDEALIALMLEDELAAAGFDVTLASNGKQALAAAGRVHYDAVVTDLNMPGVSGEELIASLRSARPSLPIVVLTGSPPVGGAATLRRHPSEAKVHLLVKPVGPGQVAETVKAALGWTAAGIAEPPMPSPPSLPNVILLRPPCEAD